MSSESGEKDKGVETLEGVESTKNGLLGKLGEVPETLFTEYIHTTAFRWLSLGIGGAVAAGFSGSLGLPELAETSLRLSGIATAGFGAYRTGELLLGKHLAVLKEGHEFFKEYLKK